MKVLFLQNVTNVAKAGDVKEVKDGYARNFLIPKKLATLVTPNELQRVEKLKKLSQEQTLRESKQWQEVAQALEGQVINVKVRVGINEQLYGSVTNTMIASELERLTGREIDRHKIVLKEPIRQLGEFEIPIRLHEDVSAKIKVIVATEGKATEVQAEAIAAEPKAEEKAEEQSEKAEEQQN